MLFAILLAATGLTLSAVAIYYSVIGLTAVFAAAFWPVVIMGTTLEVAKLVAASWLKMYWERIPRGMKIYMSTAVVVLMVITSMGIFGFLSKAHLDQNIVSGDVQGKIAIYDEKIATAKGNIDANRRALKQMDEAVDQVMGRSQDEKGADKAVALRRGQAKERTRLLSEITAEQKTIAKLSEERAPIAAEVRKVEAEVGPIKYIAAFVYGDNPDANILEKAVTWVIIILIAVFDPLALILLLASQISFQSFREQEEKDWGEDYFQGIADDLNEAFESQKPDAWVADVGEKPTKEELDAFPELKDDFLPTFEEITPKVESTEGDSPEKESDIVSTATVTEPAPHHPDTHPYLRQGFGKGFENLKPMVYKPEVTTSTYQIFPELQVELDKQDEPLFVQNEEQKESNLWSKTIVEPEPETITEDDYLNVSQEKLDQTINKYATWVREKKITMASVPAALLPAVRARV